MEKIALQMLRMLSLKIGIQKFATISNKFKLMKDRHTGFSPECSESAASESVPNIPTVVYEHS